MSRKIIITESQYDTLVGASSGFNIRDVYHVSRNNFNRFQIVDNRFPYLFFSSKPIVLYGANIVYQCNLSMHNPVVCEGGMSWSYPLWLYLSDKDGQLIPEEEFTRDRFDGYLGCPYELWKKVYYDDFEYEMDQLPELVNGLNMGYDGVIMKGIDEGDTSIMVDDYIVFSPEQVEIVNKGILN